MRADHTPLLCLRSPGSPAMFLVLALAASMGACSGSAGDELDCSREDLCEEVNHRYRAEVESLVETMNTCEVRQDCTSVVPTLGCDQQATWLTTCAQGVRADQAAAFEAAVQDLESQFCTECDLECHHDDELACTAPIAKCEDGRCVVEFMEDAAP